MSINSTGAGGLLMALGRGFDNVMSMGSKHQQELQKMAVQHHFDSLKLGQTHQNNIALATHKVAGEIVAARAKHDLSEQARDNEHQRLIQRTQAGSLAKINEGRATANSRRADVRLAMKHLESGVTLRNGSFSVDRPDPTKLASAKARKEAVIAHVKLNNDKRVGLAKKQSSYANLVQLHGGQEALAKEAISNHEKTLNAPKPTPKGKP